MSRPLSHEVDLHGFYPQEPGLFETIDKAMREAFEAGAETLTLIHGHGHNRRLYKIFANTNTGHLGMSVRSHLRRNSDLSPYMLAKFDCSHDGSTTVRIRRKPKEDS